MPIPAGEADVSHVFTYSNGTQQTYTLWSAALHMHELGNSATLSVRHNDGSEQCLLDIPAWDFHWQGAYFFKKAVALEPDDTVTLTCHWKNDGAGAVYTEWGEGTSDEMCLGTVYTTITN
jgi:hypothetical protein